MEELEDTLKRASDLIKEYRGAVARRNKRIKLILAILGAVIVILAILSGMVGEGSYWGPMLIV